MSVLILSGLYLSLWSQYFRQFVSYRKDGVKRIMSDEQIRERMKAPSADMDTLETDGISLKENKENHTSNSYMDELVFNEKEQNK